MKNYKKNSKYFSKFSKKQINEVKNDSIKQKGNYRFGMYNSMFIQIQAWNVFLKDNFENNNKNEYVYFY